MQHHRYVGLMQATQIATTIRAKGVIQTKQRIFAFVCVWMKMTRGRFFLFLSFSVIDAHASPFPTCAGGRSRAWGVLVSVDSRFCGHDESLGMICPRSVGYDTRQARCLPCRVFCSLVSSGASCSWRWDAFPAPWREKDTSAQALLVRLPARPDHQASARRATSERTISVPLCSPWAVIEASSEPRH